MADLSKITQLLTPRPTVYLRKSVRTTGLNTGRHRHGASHLHLQLGRDCLYAKLFQTSEQRVKALTKLGHALTEELKQT